MASQKRTQVAAKKQREQINDIMYSSVPNLTSNRLLNHNKDENILQDERLRHERLIGQLKAAEARNR